MKLYGDILYSPPKMFGGYEYLKGRFHPEKSKNTFCIYCHKKTFTFAPFLGYWGLSINRCCWRWYLKEAFKRDWMNSFVYTKVK